MQTETDNSGPAFPHDEKTHDGSHWFTHPGMTLRDYFAGQALAGMGTWCPWVDDGHNRPVGDLTDPRVLAARAAWAGAQADAMLTERAKGGR
jgi:hypothetical protein